MNYLIMIQKIKIIN